MTISTNSIIHYTNRFDSITSILQEGFRIKYCAEVLKLGSNNFSKAAHPMISFCDIPLSDSKQHFSAYGRYGIGLSKAWGMKKGVNPVIYIDENSLIAKSIYNLIKARRKNDTNLTEKQKREILKIKSYAKNYSGSLKKGKINNQNYKFYDEREWRLVPNTNTLNGAKFSISLSAYQNNKEKYNDKLKNCRVFFDVEDVSYIILDKTSQIHKMIKFLKDTYEDRCTSKELDILFSKICSTEQIVSDY